MAEPIVLGEIKTTNFELLRLMKNGGTLDSRGIKKERESLFTIRTIRTGWEQKVGKGQIMFGVTLQIVSNGIDNATARKDVVVHTVKGDTVIKEVEKKPKVTQKTFTTDSNVENKAIFKLEDIE